MKKLVFVLGLTMLAIFISCSNTDLSFIGNGTQTTPEKSIEHKISQKDAIDIAHLVLSHSQSRTNSSIEPRIEYVTSVRRSRSQSHTMDTLAYVINFPNDGGFVIVASTNRIYPVLGFSDHGHFSFSNEIANDNFISNIENYIESSDNDTSYVVNDSFFAECYNVSPAVKISIGQYNPWNKYVTEEHPGCPAGCVAVASALVMSHSRYTLYYHGVLYQLKSIISAIEKGPGTFTIKDPDSIYTPPRRIVGGSASRDTNVFI